VRVFSGGERRRLRRFAALLTLLLAALGAVEGAHAAVWLVFEPLSAPPGATVRGFTEYAPFPARVFLTSNLQASIRSDRVEVGGDEGIQLEVAGSAPIRVSFVPLLIAEDLQSGKGLPLVSIGELRPDGKGSGSLRFTVPDLPPGYHASLLYYEETDAAPGQFIAGQVFEVESKPAKERDAVAPILGASLAGFLLVAGSAFLILRRRRRFTN
jgi:hypothetical protein